MSSSSASARIANDIALSLVFFTRLPLPVLDFGDRKLADAIWAAPIAGVVVAVIGAATFTLAASFGVASGPAAALTLAAMMLTTGSLHEDGFSDVADGFGGGRTPERKLEIMHDSRIGAYGASALGLSILIRWSALAEFSSGWSALLALVAAHAASRGLLGAFLHWLPSATAEGLSTRIGTVSLGTAQAGIVLGAVALLVLGLDGALAAAILLAMIFIFFRRLCLNQIGGHTGDAAGALQQLCEIAVLIVASVALT
ncbi:MAG TPA: adenosylcobinamide-GDP ribazoletransferase [Mesorhizobium sp.]|jgi:adenosylcobinamide-GDP ribazoletransferase|uniref:adenosylcobinamide-GDP ribazoletransferase n=1 Tax=Mesorhizobium sp. TaxID=1871066 RepID=UPI002DDCA83D|nr:adenosylcobinamide-GDP ribazoletransferase [Mesorhizobium sp.]HEV2504721.1 adenosylcobinamide-GDP ribazoletransferase [Mesorhizobium sp.]